MLKRLTLTIALGIAGLSSAAGADDWKPLLTGDDFADWQTANGTDAFRIDKGTLTVDGPGQIVYAPGGQRLDLRDFELRADVLTQPGGRAGLTFHFSSKDPRASGGLEVRIDNSYGRSATNAALLKTGSLVWLRPVVKSPAADSQWFRLQISVNGRRVQVRADKELLVDYVEPDNPKLGPRLKRGTIAVRGHDGSGAVLIRGLQVRPLAEAAPGPAAKTDEAAPQIARLRELGFPLVDYHIRLKDGLTPADVLAWSRQTGLGPGIVIPGGNDLPVHDDQTAAPFLDKMRGRPAFVGLFADGRDWPKRFSPATLARFDYVCADARTLTDAHGKRTRLWVKEEVDITDPQAFMDRLVVAIETILDREPIDVYANPTYLPETLAEDYDRLWTPERLRRVADALARNGVALEINDRLQLPHPPLIKLAKRAGVKFAFGGANADRTLGRLAYGRRMIEECALTPDDLWAPQPPGRKPIQTRARR